MAGNVSGLHIFQADTGPEPLALLDQNYTALVNPLNGLITFSNYYVDSGGAGALVITVVSPQIVAYNDGLLLQVKVAATQASAGATINVNALGSKSIVNPDGSALVPNQLPAGCIAQLQFSASSNNFILVGLSGFSYPKMVLGPAPSGVTLIVNGVFNQDIVRLIGATGSNSTISIVDGQTGNNIWSITNGLITPNTFSISQNGFIKLHFDAGANLSAQGPVAGALIDLTPDTGTFTGTFTGFTSVVTGTCTWSRVGKLVMLAFPSSAHGTSNATTFTMTGLPSAIQPATLSQVVGISAAGGIEDNSAPQNGAASITAGSGTISFITATGGWTPSGAKGFTQPTVIYYMLN